MGRNWTKRNVLILAAVLGLITGVVFYTTQPKPLPKTDTAVACEAIPRGVLVTADMVALKPLYLQDRSPLTLNAVVGKVARVDISQGAEILAGQLGPRGLSASLRKGMRAVSVAVDAVISVGGFAQPGDRVDVVATYTRGDQPSTRTILQNVELLAVGPDVQSKSKGTGETAQPDRKTATLIVTPAQAQMLTLADNQGKLRLILRNPNDTELVAVRETTAKPPPVSVREIHSGTPVRQQQPVAVRPNWTGLPPLTVPVAPAPPTIEVIRGNVKTQEVLTKG